MERNFVNRSEREIRTSGKTLHTCTVLEMGVLLSPYFPLRDKEEKAELP